jgi:hypothetical protein
VTVNTLTSGQLPGLYFFVVAVPVGHIEAITALDRSGAALLAANEAEIPQGP